MAARKVHCPVLVEAIRVLSESAKLKRGVIASRLGVKYQLVNDLQHYHGIRYYADGRRERREPPVWTADAVKNVWDRVAAGESIPAIAKDIGHQPGAVYAALDRYSELKRAALDRSARLQLIAERNRSLRAPKPPRDAPAPFTPVAWQSGSDGLLRNIRALARGETHPQLLDDLCQEVALLVVNGAELTRQLVHETATLLYKGSHRVAWRVSLDEPQFDDGDSNPRLDRLALSGRIMT